ncbi:hypothetical protein FF011L_04100 [Roseimaritima multifibrata]|uniref:Uncharacterized protein n=1 Tax=Roseimaritima multifibrata TaxID=1930274 RepID=A0A517M9W2_9BACT|nr:hypothetical protein FF011L_04100 [Roseimaritima multifibrata]
MTMEQEPVELLLVPGLHNTDNAMDMARLAMNAPLEQVSCSSYNRQQIAAVLWLVCDQFGRTAQGTGEITE